MQDKIDAITQAISNGSLTLDDAVRFTMALADGTFNVVNKLFKVVEGLV